MASSACSQYLNVHGACKIKMRALFAQWAYNKTYRHPHNTQATARYVYLYNTSTHAEHAIKVAALICAWRRRQHINV